MSSDVGVLHGSELSDPSFPATVIFTNTLLYVILSDIQQKCWSNNMIFTNKINYAANLHSKEERVANIPLNNPTWELRGVFIWHISGPYPHQAYILEVKEPNNAR